MAHAVCGSDAELAGFVGAGVGSVETKASGILSGAEVSCGTKALGFCLHRNFFAR